MKKSARFFILAASASAAAMLVSCATDVPVPENEQAQEWSPKIKSSYPGWQPPREMPAGNPEYEATFSKAAAPAAPAGKKAAVADDLPELDLDAAFAPTPAPAPGTGPAETIRLEIVGAAPNSCRVNGDLLSDDMTVKFLEDSIAAAKNTKVEIVWRGDRGAAQGKVFEKTCRDLGYKSVSTRQLSVPPPQGPKAAAAAKKAAAAPKRVIDRSVPGTEYTVVKGDSLSVIAKKLYQDGKLWPIIFRENKTVLKNDANRLKPGMKLVIPALKQAPAR